jgi:YVTN family beta-propeller protein
VGSNGRGIAVIDPATHAITGSISISGANLTGIAFTPDSAHAYVGEFFGTLYLLDARANTVLQTIPLTGSVGGGISDVVVSPDGRKVYVGNERTSPSDPGHNVFAIDTATNSVIGQIPVSFPSPEMAITTDGANLLVGDSDIGSLIVASTSTDSVVESIHVNAACCPTITGVGAKPSGVVFLPQLSVPSSVDFGTVVLGAQPTSSIQLLNPGHVPVTITALTVSDPNFSIVTPPQTPIVIAPGASTQIFVMFAPAAKGTFSGTLSIFVLGLPSPPSVALAGNAILPPFLQVLPPALDFGTVSIAETKQLQVQIQNTGDAPLIGSVSLSPSDVFAIAGPTDFFVLGGQSAPVSVNFAPRARTKFSATLKVSSNVGESIIPMSGVGEKVAVVLVHGFNSDPTTAFGEMKPLLSGTANLDVFTFDYSADTKLTHGLPIERIAANLASFIAGLTANQGIDRVDVVAHSMGGLVTRAYIADMAIQNGVLVPYAGNIRKLVTIGTPNYGVPPRLATNFDSLQNREVQEMLFSSDFTLRLNKNWEELVSSGFTPRMSSKDILTIIGTQTPNGSVFPFLIDDDAVVPGPSATLPCSFLSCDGQPADQNVRYVPYQHADIEVLGVDILGNNPAESFVLDKNFQTFRLVFEFLLEKPLGITFAPPAQFTDNGLLLMKLIDADTGNPIRIFDSPITSVLVDGLPLETNINGKGGAITLWPISAARHRIQIGLSSFVYPDPDPLSIDIGGERPTTITLLLRRRRLL